MEAASQPESLQNGHKRQRLERPRPLLSCLECKRKKIKCNRQLPCNQCRKLAESNKAARCVYASPPDSLSPVPDDSRAEYQPQRPPPSVSSGGLRTQYAAPTAALGGSNDAVIDLQHRVANIERLLAMPSAAFTPAASHVGTPDSLPSKSGILYLKKGRVRYGPPGFLLTLIMDSFPEIRAWMDKARDDPVVTSMKRDFRAYQKIFTRGQKCALVQMSIQTQNLDEVMMDYMLKIPVMERFIDMYFEHFEIIYKILHGPTFYRTFKEFKACPLEVRNSKFAAFVPHVTIVSLLGASLDQQTPFFSEIAGLAPAPQCVIDTMEAWLERTPRKARGELDYLRSQCLLLLTLHINQAPAQQQWSLCGTVVRSAMMMGLHQDPSQFPVLSIFQAEMRRRLWFAIVEFDLQISIRFGMPSMVRSCNYNTRPPANLNEFELQENMDFLPSHPAHQFTTTSCQIALAHALPIRLEALELNQNVTVAPEYDQILRVGKSLERFLQDLPACLKVETQDQPDKNISRTFNLTMLNCHIIAPLTALYLPYTISSLQQPRVYPGHRIYEEANHAYLTCAAHVLWNLDFFRTPPASSAPSTTISAILSNDPTTGAATSTAASLKHGFYTLYHRLCSAAIMRAALITGLQIRACAFDLTSSPSPPPSTPPSPNRPPSPSYLLNQLCATLAHALSILASPDGDLREALVLALVRAHVSTPPDASIADRDARLRDAADMVLAACRAQLGPLLEIGAVSPAVQLDSAGVGGLDPSDTGLAHNDMAMYSDGSPGGGSKEFIGAEGMDLTTGLGWDWDMDFSWI